MALELNTNGQTNATSLNRPCIFVVNESQLPSKTAPIGAAFFSLVI